jgi:hypothetical protein
MWKLMPPVQMFSGDSISRYKHERGYYLTYFNLCTVDHPGPEHDRSATYFDGLRLKYGHASFLSVAPLLSVALHFFDDPSIWLS